MKSSPLHSISPLSVVPRIRLSRSFAALFAAALAMGLGAQSVLAQGPYYPDLNPNGGGLTGFAPNGFPVISNSELNSIEAKLAALSPPKTLIIPLPTGKTSATVVDYSNAVKAVAKDVANGLGGAVTVATLSAEVAKYRQAPPSQVSDGLGAIAAGILASAPAGGVPAKQAFLEALAFNAAKVDPVGTTGYNGTLVKAFNAVAADNALIGGVGAMTKNVLLGAVAGNPPPAALTPSRVNTLLVYVLGAIQAAPTSDTAAKSLLIKGLATTVLPTIVGTPGNIDQASAALLASGVQPFVGTFDMVVKIKAAIGAPSDAKYGEIAQGGLRAYSAASGNLRLALNTTYTNDLIDAFNGIAFPVNAGGWSQSHDPVATAAAAATKFPASAAAIVKDVLNQSGASGTQVVDIIGRGIVAAPGTPPQNIATAAVNAGSASLTDVTTAAITSAPIGSAGLIARAVLVAGGLSDANATTVGGTAITAAAAASPSANKADAYADIAYNLAYVLQGTPAVADARNSAAITAEVLAISAAHSANGGTAITSPSYTAIVGAAYGASSNRAAILAAGNAADPAADTGASTVGVNLLSAFTNDSLAKYYATLAAVAPAGSDARNLAVLYAASLGNNGDTAGSLAAMISKTGTSRAALTAAAISANRSKQTALTIVASVAGFAKDNPNADIQATIGRQILDNPTFVKEISVAATVVVPQWSHFIAHTVAFNQPLNAGDSVDGIFLHSKITNTVGAALVDKLTFGDRPGASAAITAGFATGILESQLSAAQRKEQLKNVIYKSMNALVNPLYNDVRVGPSGDFRQSTGGSNLLTDFTLVKAKGVAGGITGFIAQLVKPTDNGAAVTNPFNPASDAYYALSQASYGAGLLTGTTYQLDMAQAAAQAFAWITGISAAPAVVTDIANAIYLGYGSNGGAPQLAKLQNAVAFGLNESGGHANAGAGAGGLRDGADPFYTHHSATGTPVSNILSL